MVRMEGRDKGRNQEMILILQEGVRTKMKADDSDHSKWYYD